MLWKVSIFSLALVIKQILVAAHKQIHLKFILYLREFVAHDQSNYQIAFSKSMHDVILSFIEQMGTVMISPPHYGFNVAPLIGSEIPSVFPKGYLTDTKCYIRNVMNSLGDVTVMTSSNGSSFRVAGVALCGEITGQWLIPLTKASDVFFDLLLNKRLCKQSWGCWFETTSRSLWRQCNDIVDFDIYMGQRGKNKLLIIYSWLDWEKSFQIMHWFKNENQPEINWTCLSFNAFNAFDAGLSHMFT